MIKKINSGSDCFWKCALKVLKLFPLTRHTHTHAQYEVFILSTRQISFTIVSFCIVYGFEFEQWDRENNLHIMTCDCSSMTRYLCVVRVLCRRTSVSNTAKTGTTQWILMITTIILVSSSLFFVHEWIVLQKYCLSKRRKISSNEDD